MDKSRKRILYLFQMPPPVHGVSSINSIIYNSTRIHGNYDKSLVEIRFSETLGQLRRFSPGKAIRFFRLCRELRSKISIIRPDCIYFSVMPVGKGFWRDILLVRIIKRSGVHPIFHIHNRGIARQAKSRIFRFFYRYVFSDAGIIHLSENLLETEIRFLNLRNSLTFVLPNTSGSDAGCTADPAHPLCTIRIATSGKPVTRLLFVSNLFPAKGIYLLPHIMGKLREINMDVTLKIIGGMMRNKYNRRLVRLIDRQDIREYIELSGPMYGAELDREYNQADIFLFPSMFDQECAPLVILQAMQAGVPVVASRIGAIPEMIEHGVHGLLAEPGNIEEFTSLLEGLIQSEVQQKRMGLEAKKRYEIKYSREQFELKLGEILDIQLSGD